MTLLQAYEIFYKNISNQEITEEYIRKNIKESDLKNEKKRLNKIYNHNTIHLKRKADPDSKVLENLSEKDNLNRIIDEINRAYAIIYKCISDKSYRHNSYQEELLFTKYNQVLQKQIEKRERKNETIINKAAAIYFYKKQRELASLTEKALKETSWETDIPSMLKKINKYNIDNEQLTKLLKEKKEQLKYYKNLLKRGEFKETDIEHMEKEIAGEYHQYLQDKSLYEDIRYWQPRLSAYFEEEYQDDVSTIKNLKAKALQRLKKAKELYILIMYNKCNNFLEDTYTKVNDPKIKELDKIKLIDEYLTYRENIKNKIKENEKKYNEFSAIINNYDINKVTSKELEQIESMVKELITNEYLSMLNEKTLIKEKEKQQANNDSFKKKNNEIKKMHDQGRSKLINKICQNSLYLSKIKKEFSPFKELNLIKKSTKELIENDNAIKKQITETLKNEITKYFEFILTYCLGNYLSAEIYEDMYELAINSNSFEVLDTTYNKFKKLYSQLSKQNKNPEETKLNAKKRLKIEINNAKKQLELSKKTLSDKLIDKLEKIDSLSIIELYNLSNEVGDYYFDTAFIPLENITKPKKQ